MAHILVFIAPLPIVTPQPGYKLGVLPFSGASTPAIHILALRANYISQNI